MSRVLYWSLLVLFSALLMGSSSANQRDPQAIAAEPAPSSSAASVTVPEPIQPSSTSTLLTNISLLVVSIGGLIGASTPLILKLLRRGDSDDTEAKERQQAVVMALAAALAKANEDIYVGRERRHHDEGPPTPPGDERRVGEGAGGD